MRTWPEGRAPGLMDLEDWGSIPLERAEHEE